RPHAEQLAEFHPCGTKLLRRQTDAFPAAAARAGNGRSEPPDQSAPPVDVRDQLGEPVAGKHRENFLRADSVAEQVQRLHGSLLRSGVSLRRVSRMRTRSSRAAMRTRVSALLRSNIEAMRVLRSLARSSNSLRPCSAIFSAMMRASAALTFPCRTNSSSEASILSFVTTAAPTPASRVFFNRSIMVVTYPGARSSANPKPSLQRA